MTKVKDTLTKTLQDAGFDDVLDQKRFVLYKKEKRDDKWTKIPKQVNGDNAASTDPTTWSNFSDAVDAFDNGNGKFDGLGIILGDLFSTKIVGVDLDHVMDGISGAWTNVEAKIAVRGLKTYGERSISGTGVHYLFRDQSVPDGYKTRSSTDGPFDLEVYEKGRYFTLSGDWISKHPLAKDKEGLDTLCTTFLKKKVSERINPKIEKAIDSALLRSAMSLQETLAFDERFNSLYNGTRPFDNESSDDMALINLLVKYLGRDPSKIADEFLKSPHYTSKDQAHKDKCTARDDYLPRSIATAIENFYTGYSYDDVGNSGMFTDTYHEELVFVPEWNCWVYWDGSRWQKKADYIAQEKGKALADVQKAKLIEYRKLGNHNADLLKAMDSHVKKMRGERGISNMIKLARSSSMKSANVFDSDPLLFNCQNGVYNMVTGELMPHASKHYCTNIAGASYDVNAKAPKWEEFLNKILPEEGKKFLQMAVGMAAIGKVYEEAMIFMIGVGSNGKSTVANIVSRVFGDYSITLQPDIITATRDGKTPPDFAEVRGKRMVFISETEEGDRLSTKGLKRLTSNEKQSARRLYSQPEEFEPSHTVFYSTNHKPRIGSGDYGTWRRIKNLPFEYRFTDAEKITSFATDLLAEEAEGVLAWCMEGARIFIKNEYKLNTPELVKDATEEYKENEDIIGMFIDEKCILGLTKRNAIGDEEKNREAAGKMYAAYRLWCKDNSTFCKNISDFNNVISIIDGVSKVVVHGSRVWKGISLNE